MTKQKTIYIVKAGIIAAIYFVLTWVFGAISYGPIQFRISEALVILPMLEPAAVPGLFIGCLFANLGSPFGIVDILGGSFVTLIAAYFTSKTKVFYKGIIPPIVLNGILVSIWVSRFTGIPYLISVAYISLSEALVTSILGYIIFIIYKKAKETYSI